MRRFSLGLLAGVLVIAGSCERKVGARDEPERPAPAEGAQPPVVADGVEVVRVDKGIWIANRRAQAIAYAVWATGSLGVFTPCVDPGPECLRLAPGASEVVPFDEVVGMSPEEREVIVRWWRVVPGAGGSYRAEDLHVIAVAL